MVENDTEIHLRKKMKNSYIVGEVECESPPSLCGFALDAIHCGESIHSPAGTLCAYSVVCHQRASLEEHIVHRRSCLCTTIGRKRITSMDDFSNEIIFSDFSSLSPSSSLYTPRKRPGSPMTPLKAFDVSGCALVPLTPSTPIQRRCLVASPPAHCVRCAEDSFLDELPFDLLIRVVCCLRHDDLKQVSLVSKRVRKAVLLARQLHFSFTTPHRERKGKTSLLFPNDNEALGLQGDLGECFVRPPTPNAPRHTAKPPEARLSHFDTRPFAPPLFQDQLSVSNHCRKAKKIHGMASHRVLFNEDELCQAVAQNTL